MCTYTAPSIQFPTCTRNLHGIKHDIYSFGIACKKQNKKNKKGGGVGGSLRQINAQSFTVITVLFFSEGTGLYANFKVKCVLELRAIGKTLKVYYKNALSVGRVA